MRKQTVSNVRRKTVVTALISALVVAVIVAAILCMGYSSNPTGGNMRYHSLDYDMTVQPNGDLRVVQHLDLKLGKHPDGENGKTFWHHFYQRYHLDFEQLSAITDVSVKNVDTGQRYSKGKAPGELDLEYSSEAEWNREFARTWYAQNISCDYNTDYLPAGKKAISDDALQGKGSKDGNITDKENDGGPSKSQVRSVDDDEDDDEDWDSCASGGGQSGDTIEIGWNIPAVDTAESMKFDIAMTFKDVVTLYDDVAYFKWEPVGENNTVPIDNLHARVSLPKGASKSGSPSPIRLPRQWLHYAGKGYVKELDGHTLDFTASNIRPHQYVDLVSISDAAPMGTVAHRKSGNHARSIVVEENGERVGAAFVQGIQIAWLLTTLLALFIVIIYAVWRIVTNTGKASYRGRIEYYRDIPVVSPVAGARLLQTVDGLPDGKLMGQVMVKTRSSWFPNRWQPRCFPWPTRN
ncbi:DUF2207 domain-containing protein [Bifidobacterium sp. ESL0798]|uniref:DUF2207 domain-containing protein n=1 Tax=Bifidobacterium sp. ESL0798 TaxID=2983235 RepID=UPI0023FA3AD3|nr:DUF2207 domain-containing protein [Bifidobacterium sp. ESL0798]WEV73753.1 DUF2207 domain-containing protein [Bifidobacterium sp. ESL0798]